MYASGSMGRFKANLGVGDVMKVQTNQGECELTAEMVCRGVVFQDPKIGPYALVGYDHYAQAWITETKGTRTEAEVAIAHVFLGCDPAIASRTDCERFGVYGDADAHGFARLRDGGAVDLYRESIPGLVTEDGIGQRRVLDGVQPVPRDERFLGLVARLARPEDVDRLCCGEYGPDQIDSGNRTTWVPRCTLAIGPHDEHEDLATGVRWQEPYDVSVSGCPACLTDKNGSHEPNCDRGRCGVQEPAIHTEDENFDVCGLAIGHDGDHEDLATGVRWRDPEPVPGTPLTASYSAPPQEGRPKTAATWTYSGASAVTWTTESGFRFEDDGGYLRKDMRLSGVLCGRCAKPVDSGPFGPMMLVLPDGEQKVSAPICQVCLAHVNKDIGAWRIRGGSIEETSPEDVARYGGFPEPTAEQWERLRAAFPAHFSAGRSVGDPHPISGSLADERRLHDCPRCASGPRRTYCSVACGDAEQAARRATDRRQREAPLVALVNACPEGLDPVGWRAGVLAYAEMFRSDADFHWFRKSDMPHVLAVIRDGEKSTGMNIRVFVDAYQRALAPRAKVAPERKGMTWKTRGPALPVDDGRDD